MPFGLGFFATAGATAGGSYELIETITVGSGGAASVTFSNLNTYSSTYQHLQIRGAGKTNATGDINGDVLRVRLNGVSTSSYAAHGLYALTGQSTPFSYGVTSQTSMRAARISSNYSGTNSATFGGTVIDILDPYEAKNKTIRALGGHNSVNAWLELSSGLYLSTDSVTSVTLFGENGSFIQGSRFSIYGLKAS